MREKSNLRLYSAAAENEPADLAGKRRLGQCQDLSGAQEGHWYAVSPGSMGGRGWRAAARNPGVSFAPLQSNPGHPIHQSNCDKTLLTRANRGDPRLTVAPAKAQLLDFSLGIHDGQGNVEDQRVPLRFSGEQFFGFDRRPNTLP